MEHLPMHLLFEAKVRGLVQYRWMYPFKRLGITHAYLLYMTQNIHLIPCRYLFNLKRKVKNKMHVKTSIYEAYIIEEISIFI
jgi:hypothetical protein